MRDWESRRAMISGLRYGVTVRTLNSEIWTKSIKTSDATSMRARHGVLQDLQMSRAPVANSNRVLRPPRRRDRPLCGAKTRAGGNCMVKVELGKARCRFHGGLSTGPKTEAGRARIAETQRRRWHAFREGLRAHAAASSTVDDAKAEQANAADSGRPSPFVTS